MEQERKYFYGPESEQFIFYRIPKALFGKHYKGLSTDAKLLYGLMLDRMGLSMRNGWYDEDGRVYIYYTMAEVMEDMACAHNRATALYRELETYNLIERRKQGQGKPTMIYVLDFVDHSERPQRKVRTKSSKSKQSQQSRQPKIRQDTTVQTAQNQQSRLPDSRLHDPCSLDCTKSAVSHSNNTDNNYTDTDDRSIHHYTRSDGLSPAQIDTIIDRMTEEIKESIEYSLLCRRYNPEVINGIVNLMVDECCSDKPFQVINGANVTRRQLKSKLLSLRYDHIEYVLDRYETVIDPISNVHSYLLTMLYNASTDISIRRDYDAM